jgi:hypothetical protein
MAELNVIWCNKWNLLLNTTLEMMATPCSTGQITKVTPSLATQQLQNLNSLIRNHTLRMINQKEGQLNLTQQSINQMQAQLQVTSDLTLRAVPQASIASAQTQLPGLCCQIETMIEEVLSNLRSKEARYWDEIDGLVDDHWNLWMTARTFNSYWVEQGAECHEACAPCGREMAEGDGVPEWPVLFFRWGVRQWHRGVRSRNVSIGWFCFLCPCDSDLDLPLGLEIYFRLFKST